MRFLSFSLFLLFLPFVLAAQEYDSLHVSVDLDVVNQNIWRGQYMGGASIQPSATLGFKNLELNVWGTSEFTDYYHEIDFTLSYYFGNLRLAVTDYWCPDDIFGKFKKSHLFEGQAVYSFSRIPLSLTWGTIFSGEDGDSYSSYTEISFTPEYKGWEFELAAGASPWENETLGTRKFSVTKITGGLSRTFPVTPRSCLGIAASLHYNPHQDRMYWVCGATFSFK